MASTRDRIIVATNELFRRHGYNGTSLSQISDAAVYRELFEVIASEADNPAAAYVDFFAGAAAVLEESDFIDPCPIGTVAREVANTSEPLREAAERAFGSWIEAARDHLAGAGIFPKTWQMSWRPFSFPPSKACSCSAAPSAAPPR